MTADKMHVAAATAPSQLIRLGFRSVLLGAIHDSEPANNSRLVLILNRDRHIATHSTGGAAVVSYLGEARL